MTGDVQVPDGDRDVEAGVEADREHDVDRMECHEHGGLCCPAGDAHDMTGLEARRHRIAAVVRAALASQPAPTVTDEAVEAGWEVAPVGYGRWAIRNILTAALPHLTPAPTGDGVAEAVARERERIATAIEAVDPIEWALAGERAGQDAARIARSTTEEADHG